MEQKELGRLKNRSFPNGGFFVVLLERAVSELVWRSKVVVHVDATESGIILPSERSKFYKG